MWFFYMSQIFFEYYQNFFKIALTNFLQCINIFLIHSYHFKKITIFFKRTYFEYLKI